MKRYIVILAVALLAFTACDDILDKKPQSKLSPETYFTNMTELQLFTNSFYNNLLPKSPYNVQSDQYIKANPSDLVKGGTNRIVPNTSSNWSWTDLRKMNTCLEYMEANCKDPEAYKIYSGLCRFFRAYFYFDKVRMYGDVPWVDHEPGTSDEVLQAPRDSREVIMTHMIEDIDYAIENLPESYSSGHNYRATKWAALALKARFCLYEGTYRKYHDISYPEHPYTYYLEESAKAADRIMKEGPFKVYSTGKPNLDYAVLFSSYDEITDEYILSINFDFGTELMHNATAAALMNSQGRNSLTKKFVNCYLMTDGTRFTDKEAWQTMQFAEEVVDRDPRLGQTVRLPGYSRITENGGAYSYSPVLEGVQADITLTGYQMAKFVMPENNLANDKFDRSYNDLPVFRYGEVLLNYAEAKAELGNITQDDVDRTINLLRDRVNMPHLDVAYANAHPDPYLQTEDFYPGVTDGMILEVRRERAVELAQEGFRYDDLMRWKRGPLLARPYYGIYLPGVGVYDIDGDGKNDIALYGDGQTKPSASTATVIAKLGTDLFLSEGTRGYIEPLHNITFSFDEGRDYLYPIPINERSLNHNLTQNPGWNDGLSF